MSDMQQIEEHHKRGEVATNRPAYREARREKAVKVSSLLVFSTLARVCDSSNRQIITYNCNQCTLVLRSGTSVTLPFRHWGGCTMEIH